jgi:dihydrofolate reductase
MTISLIAGIGKNNELGKDNQLLWKLPADLKHFRDTTRGHTVIMGRKTFESLPNGALPNRRNIVITRDPNYQAENIEVVNSIEEALRLVMPDSIRHPENENLDSGSEAGMTNQEVFVIGGAEIYKQALPFANKLYITHVAGEFAADTFFPTIDSSWKEVSRVKNLKDDQNQHDFDFVVYER